MSVDAEAEPVTQSREARSRPTGASVLALIIRLLARLWIVLMLLAGAAVAGVAATQMLQKQAELEDLRREPGANAYALLAYRAELERQIQAIRDDRQLETVPMPPARPTLLEEIDLARARNESLRSQVVRSESLGGISAPP